MEAYVSDAFLDRVRRAYCFALDAGARTRGRVWRSIDGRRRDVHSALIANGNKALREIFSDPVATDLYFGTDNLCRSIIGSGGDKSFLTLALESRRAHRGRYQLEQLSAALASINGRSIVEIGPGVGHCAFFAFRSGLTDYTTIDLPLGIVAQARFLAEAIAPDCIWIDGEPDPRGDQIKLFSVARLPMRQFDVALNVDSMTEMSLQAALDYATWINLHARLFLSMNHELNPFTVTDIARHCIAGECIMRSQWPDRPGYVQERFLIDQQAAQRKGLMWLHAKTLFWSIAVPIRWRLPFLRPPIVPG